MPPKGGRVGGTGGISVDSLVDYMRNYVDVPRNKGRLIVRTMFKTMIAALHAGDSIIIPGFGSFLRRTRRGAYINFTKGGKKTWYARTRIIFRPAIELKYLVHKGVPHGRN